MSIDHRTPAFQTVAPIASPRTTYGNPVCPPRLRRGGFVAAPRPARPCWGPIASAAPKNWAGLDAPTFDTLLDSGTLPLCLVGMSNCGKSHWSRKLRDERHFRMQSVDVDIEHALKPELEAGGFYGIDGLAAWMGFPTDERFARAQHKYLAAEEAVTSTARGVEQQGWTSGNCVLDTTGSVVYLKAATLARLRERFFVVHLMAGDDMLESMTKRFFETPKPVVWGDAFDRADDETADQAIRRCYPRLLRERRLRYEKLAHVNVQASDSLSRALHLDGFLELVRAQLE